MTAITLAGFSYVAGFTQVFITLDAGGTAPNTSVPLTQQGLSYNGTGSRVIYVSSSTGHSIAGGGTGTLANPLSTILEGTRQLRDGFPDQCLLLCGDTFPSSDYFSGPNGDTVPFNGAAVTGNVGGVVSGPILLSYYGNTANGRPKINVDSTGPIGSCLKYAWTAAHPTGNNFAIMGLELYGWRKDPNGANYTYAGATSIAQGIQWEVQSTWLLIEDCLCHYVYTDIEYFWAASPTTPATGSVLYFRRNILHHIYDATGGHIDTLHLSFINTLNMESNLIAFGGWDPDLTAPTVVSISATTLTWPTSPMLLGNGAKVYFQNSDAGGNVHAGTAYFVVGTTGNNFSVATAPNGAALSFTGTSNTIQWVDAWDQTLSHLVYGSELNGTNNPGGSWRNNIFLWGTDNLCRYGGLQTGNYYSYTILGTSLGIVPGSDGSNPSPPLTNYNINHNIFQHEVDLVLAAPQFTGWPNIANGGFGMNITNAQCVSPSNGLIQNNIWSQFPATSSPTPWISINDPGNLANAVSNGTFTNNIIYNASIGMANNGVSENGSSFNTGLTISNSVEQDNLNTAGYPNPGFDLNTYDATQVPGGNGTWQHFFSLASTRAMQTWPSYLTAAAINNYIANQGFGQSWVLGGN